MVPRNSTQENYLGKLPRKTTQENYLGRKNRFYLGKSTQEGKIAFYLGKTTQEGKIAFYLGKSTQELFWPKIYLPSKTKKSNFHILPRTAMILINFSSQEEFLGRIFLVRNFEKNLPRKEFSSSQEEITIFEHSNLPRKI